MAVATGSPTRQVVDYIRSTTLDDVPASVIERLKLHLLDATAAALYGSKQEWTEKILGVLSSWGGEGQASVWFHDARLPVPHAAFVNTVSTHAFELDDRRVAAYMHPASATLPTALAISETLGTVDGRRLLAAIVVGYEVGLRVGKCIGRGSHSRGYYAPGLGGSFAAVATAAHLLELSEEEVFAALNITATQASGLYSPTMIKRFNIGRGTYNGLLAAQMARAGFSGVQDVFEADFGGFCRGYAGDVDLSLLTNGLGSDFETAKVELKPYVSSRPNHTSIDCILALTEQHPEITVDSVASIEIETSVANYHYGADFEVRTVANALMSVEYCVAVAFLDGDVFLDQFTEDRLAKGDVQELMDRMSTVANDEFDRQGIEMRDMTRVRVRLVDGREFEEARSFAKGHPSDPLTDSEVLTKVQRLVGDRLGPARLDRLVDTVRSLDKLKDVGDLSAQLIAAAS